MYSQNFTYTSLRENVLKMLERFSSNGNENTVGEVKDIEKRLYGSAERHLRKLYDEFGVGKKRARIVLEAPSCKYELGSFTVDPDNTFVLNFDGDSLAYRVVAEGSGELVFLQSGATPRCRIDTRHGEAVEYCGLIEQFDADRQLVAVSSDRLNVISLEIYSGVSQNEEDLELLLGKDIGCARLPEDTSRVIGIYDTFGRALQLSDFCIDGDMGRISADKCRDGVYTVEYLPCVGELTEANADSYVISLPPVLFDALCYACAADVCPTSDGDTFSRLTYKYREILANYYDRYTSYSNGRNSFYGCVGRKKLPSGR